ncbi:MAG: hypothetical protein ACTHM6_16390 [Tepidisphaeraceae bacterium]
MANGFHGPEAEWKRMEAPLLQTDEIFRTIAEKHHLHLSSNVKLWPGRLLTWGKDIRRLVHLFLEDDKALTFKLWLCASEDRPGARYCKQELLINQQPIEAFLSNLPSLLEEAYCRVNSWQSEQLEFATVLGSGPVR